MTMTRSAGALEIYDTQLAFTLLASSSSPSSSHPNRAVAEAMEDGEEGGGWHVEQLEQAGLTKLDWSDDGLVVQVAAPRTAQPKPSTPHPKHSALHPELSTSTLPKTAEPRTRSVRGRRARREFV